MSFPSLSERRARLRTLEMFSSPRLWRTWPFLPVARTRSPGGEQQLGVLYDARHASGRYGFSATVILVNLFLLPPTEAGLFALPRCVYDTAEEMADDGWAVD